VITDIVLIMSDIVVFKEVLKVLLSDTISDMSDIITEVM
jgi:hypothetical protein